MSFKCIKCLRVKPTEVFTLTFCDEKICDFCRNGIEENAVKRKEEIKRCIDCENKTPVLKRYGETPEAKKAVKTRRSIEAIIESRKLEKEISDL